MFYSYLNASIGLLMAALRAGYRPNTSPTTALTPTPKITATIGKLNNHALPKTLLNIKANKNENTLI